MNIFRLAGDMTQLASILVLLLKIHTIKSCAVHTEHYTWLTGLIATSLSHTMSTGYALLYADFFYYYFDSWQDNRKLQLPARDLWKVVHSSITPRTASPHLLFSLRYFRAIDE